MGGLHVTRQRISNGRARYECKRTRQECNFVQYVSCGVAANISPRCAFSECPPRPHIERPSWPHGQRVCCLHKAPVKPASCVGGVCCVVQTTWEFPTFRILLPLCL